MADKYQQEGNTDHYQTEDASGDYLTEIDSTQGSYRSMFALWIGGAAALSTSVAGPSRLMLTGVG